MSKQIITTNLWKYPTMNDFYTKAIWDDNDKIVEFSDMCVDIFEQGYKAGVKKSVKRIIVGGLVVAIAFKVAKKKLVIEIEEEQK